MHASDLLALRSDLDRFLQAFDDCAGRPSRRHIATYIRGQLGPLQRKSIEPIALAAGTAPRTLQELLSLHLWDEDRMRTILQERVRQAHAGRQAIGLIDETSFAKKGLHTPGVQRQYCGATGKTDNCTVTVHLGLADDNFHALLDAELYLPQSWNEDRARCQAAQIPPALVYRPKTAIAVELIDRATAAGVEFGWFVFDEGYGGKPAFLAALQTRGHRYVGEVPRNLMGWSQTPPILTDEVEGARMGRPRHFPRLADTAVAALPVERLAATGFDAQTCTYHIKDTDKGPEVWHIQWQPFYPQIDGFPGPLHWLIKATPLADAEVKYFVSNAASGVPLEAILQVAFSRWHVERCFEDGKGEIGLDHFEVRNYRSLKRHLILSAVSFLFLAETCQRLRGEKSRMDRLPSPAGDRGAA
jgi:SRSO17 transposase